MNMKNKKITRKLSHGMYVLTTNGGGCMVDAVCQASAGDNPIIAVSVMKSNYTHELMQKNNTFALSVLGLDVNPKVIETFGLNSTRNINKFENVKNKSIDDLNIIDDSLGYLICEKIDSIDCGTHTLFLGKMIEGDVYQDKDAMTYNYYQEHKDELIKVKTDNNKTAWVCTVCGYIYYGDVLPSDFICPVCGASAEYFEKQV